MKAMSNPNGNSELYKAELMAKMDEMNNDLESKLGKGTKKRVRRDIQDKVDEYLDTYIEMKSLESRLKELRSEIEPYMDEYNIGFLEGSEGGRIEIGVTNRAVTTSRFTSYDKDGILSLVDAEVASQCIVEVVDKDVLELLVKLGKAPKEVDGFKLLNPAKVFRTKPLRR